MKLVIASRNKGKIEELARILAIVAPTVELIGSDQFPELSDVEETGDTFEANALLKARTICRETGLPAIADDSGLCVDALNGAPGIYSARYAGVDASDAENLNQLLHALLEVKDDARTARYRCALVYVRHVEDEQPLICEASWEGRITRHKQGTGGFGYDPIFWLSEYGCTAAELSAEVKNSISHRGQALQQLLRALSNASAGSALC